jgi:dipeptidase E
MKLLLTSAGVKNESIHKALLALLGKPSTECNALCIPTGGYGHPHGSPAGAWRFVSGQEPRCPMVELGWKSMGLLELTALPHIAPDRWSGLGNPSYAIDDQTAIQVVDGTVKVISEENWRYFA